MTNKTYKVIESARVDVAYSTLANISRSQATKAIKNGEILVNDKLITSPSFKVKENDVITYQEIEKEEKVINKPKDDVKIDFIYQDKDISIINKPRGMVVHPAPGHNDDTLVNYMMLDQNFNFDEDIDDIRPGIVHRIDKDTSGLLAVANNVESQAILQNEIREGEFHRCYLALVYGNVPNKRFKIDFPLTRPNHTVRKAMVDEIKGREAITHCTVLANNGKVTLLKVTLETGRTHQIRAHLSYIGFPIVGDPLYGRRKEEVATKGQALHAYSLSLIHPSTFKRVTYYAPIDDYFKYLLRYFYK